MEVLPDIWQDREDIPDWDLDRYVENLVSNTFLRALIL
jgi:hypothetical protein